MLSVIMTAFLSFSIINGSGATIDPYATSEASEIHDMSIYGPNGNGDASKVPGISVTTGEYDAGWWRNGLVGRHQMVSIGTPTYAGFKEIKQLSKWIYTTAFTDYVYKESCTYIVENSISATLEVSSSVATKIGAEIKVDGIGLEVGTSVTTSYKVSETTTYTYSEQTTSTLELTVDKNVVYGKNFAICEAAHIYEIPCKQWQYDDYWWGKSKVDGSESSFTAYVFAQPGITVVLGDGTVIK